MNTYRKALIVGITLLPALAVAHTGGASQHGFMDGFTHPFLGMDHLAAMLMVGVWSALNARKIWLAPLVFVTMLAVGAVLGQNGITVPQLEPLVATSVLVLGLMLIAPNRTTQPVALAVIGGFALCHGMAHGGELAGYGSVMSGIVAGSTLLHGLGMTIGHVVLRERRDWARRLGQAVVLLGGGLLTSTFF